jgi:hypothetical protein
MSKSRNARQTRPAGLQATPHHRLQVSGICKRSRAFWRQNLRGAGVKLWVSSAPVLIRPKKILKISGLKNGPGLYIAFNSWL